MRLIAFCALVFSVLWISMGNAQRPPACKPIDSLESSHDFRDGIKNLMLELAEPIFQERQIEIEEVIEVWLQHAENGSILAFDPRLRLKTKRGSELLMGLGSRSNIFGYYNLELNTKSRIEYNSEGSVQSLKCEYNLAPNRDFLNEGIRLYLMNSDTGVYLTKQKISDRELVLWSESL